MRTKQSSLVEFRRAIKPSFASANTVKIFTVFI